MLPTPARATRGPVPTRRTGRNAARQGAAPRLPVDVPARPRPRARVLVISGSVGAGHDGAAAELAARLRRLGIATDVRDYLDALPRPCRFLLRRGYTASVDRVPVVFEWLFRGIEGVPTVHSLATAFCALGERAVSTWVGGRRYDAVVSTYPLASQSLGELKARGELDVPLVTYLTDPAVHRLWVHPGVDQHLTVGVATARQGQVDYRVDMRAVGPLVPDRFRRALPAKRRALLREQLGLPADRPVVLLVTGSLGLGNAPASARHVLAAGMTPLVLCGRNRQLRRRLDGVPGVVALGWRQDVPELMHVADVLVHNAGGLSFTEALVAGLPAVSYRCIPGHGRANAAVLEAAGLAPWARDDSELGPALWAQAARGRALLPRPGPDAAQTVAALVCDPAVDHLPVRRPSADPAA